MPALADFIDQPERMAKSFWVSLTLHIAVLGGLTAGQLIPSHRLTMGSPTGGGMGAYMVNPVKSIPLPNQGGRENPVANDTKSQVPTPPAPKVKPKPIPKVRVPEPDAIPLKSERAPIKHRAEVQPPPQPNNTFREKQTYSPSQLYSDVGPRASSPMYQVPGGGGVGLGDNSPFGEQFGAYANIIRDNIARNWKPMRAGGAPAAVITFTIRRDGSIANVKVATSSGNQSFDFSAERAVLDAQLPALPLNFPRNQADVQLKFELGQ
ncbi:MAG TPA: TonB family protein [Bryobacteraceae bacterium]|nr:TonB family protein [Bryobacteraceae bacterium]